MTPTKDQQAQKYADRTIASFGDSGVPCGIKDIKQMIADGYVDGYTACEQSMWRSVEQEPSDREKILVVYYNLKYGTRYMADIYHKEAGFSRIPGDVIAWMPIPPIPDTNTEKI